MIDLPRTLDYPIVAIGDLHGQRDELERLVEKLEALPEWPDCALVFLGDFVDRGPRRPGDDRPRDGIAAASRRAVRPSWATTTSPWSGPPGSTADPPSPYWVDRYRTRYDHHETFEGYLGRTAMTWGGAWEKDLDALREAIPEEHRDFLASLPWLVEAPGHLFLHNGLSHELVATAEEQVEALRARRWDRSLLRPIPGTATDMLWEPEYPVWLGADRGLSESPLPHPGKVQVTGHDRVRRPDVNDVRIRLDTSGGVGTLTACLLRSAAAEPVFMQGR